MNTALLKLKRLLKFEESKSSEIAGSIRWLLPNGIPHRKYGPAIVYENGSEFWFLNGKLHREDGPAIILADGSKEYWIEGDPVNPDVFLKRLDSKNNE